MIKDSFINKIDVNEQSILKAKDIVLWKKKRSLYNFSILPETVVISINKGVLKKQIRFFKKQIKGITGVHYQYNANILFCSNFGYGAPAMFSLLEELKVLGVKRFIFIGTAGMLNNSVKEGHAYIVSKVFSSIGASIFYSKEEEIKCYDQRWFEEIKQKCNLEEKIGWSTDCPYRETVSLLNYYKSKDCALVDMESAALYSFSQYYKMPSLCILIGADSLASLQWKAPNNLNLILKVQQQLVSQILKL